MLFRIQSIWLLLSAITLGLIFVLDLYRFPNGEEISIFNQYFNTILAAINVVLIFFTIFKFKSLKSQVSLSLVSILINIMLIGTIFYFISTRNEQMAMNGLTNSQYASGDYLLGAFAPIASILFSILAIRGVKKDQKILKDSYDRLR